MTKDHLCIVIDELMAWVDATLAVGMAGMGAKHRTAGNNLAIRLKVIGFTECGKALHTVLEAEPAESILYFGRLMVVLELTRESFEIERITGGIKVNES